MHVWPQAPQLSPSLASLVQALPQRVCPDGHSQLPDWQVSPPPHAWPQVPQLASSVAIGVHALPHSV
jgi:hypothetical protein